jgi:hypothetical protein
MSLVKSRQRVPDHGEVFTPAWKVEAMLDQDGQAITFAEWGYLGKGKYQRRDFRFDVLTGSSAFSAEGALFADLGKHEIFAPIKIHPHHDGARAGGFAGVIAINA